MGRYKDYHREPRRGGFDNEQRSDNRASGSRGSRSGYPRTSTSQASEPVEAVVKWFNAEKGFGFVDVVGGSEAFMHIRQLEAAGHRTVPEGARVKVRIGRGQKGPEVTEIIEVLSGTIAVGRTVHDGHHGLCLDISTIAWPCRGSNVVSRVRGRTQSLCPSAAGQSQSDGLIWRLTIY
jgi:cold shock CspA family protein